MPETPRKRKPTGGRHVTFWANTAVQAKLERFAKEQGLSANQALRVIVQEWAEKQPA